jgi:hypothetical protein
MIEHDGTYITGFTLDPSEFVSHALNIIDTSDVTPPHLRVENLNKSADRLFQKDMNLAMAVYHLVDYLTEDYGYDLDLDEDED